jgi:hypothetical protein
MQVSQTPTNLAGKCQILPVPPERVFIFHLRLDRPMKITKLRGVRAEALQALFSLVKG